MMMMCCKTESPLSLTLPYTPSIPSPPPHPRASLNSFIPSLYSPAPVLLPCSPPTPSLPHTSSHLLPPIQPPHLHTSLPGLASGLGLLGGDPPGFLFHCASGVLSAPPGLHGDEIFPLVFGRGVAWGSWRFLVRGWKGDGGCLVDKMKRGFWGKRV